MHPFIRPFVVHPFVVRPSIFLFPDDNLRKCQWIFTNLGICIDILEIWLRIPNGQISLVFDKFSVHYAFMFSFQGDNLSKNQWIFTKLSLCIDIVEI